MFNIASIIIGIVAFIGALVAFLPLLGWANWLLIPVALVGLVLGVMSKSTAGRNLNIVVLIVCALRLPRLGKTGLMRRSVPSARRERSVVHA